MKKVIKGLVKGTLSPLGVGIMAADEIAFPPPLADGTMDAQKARERQDLINKLPKETRKKLKSFEQFREEMVTTGAGGFTGAAPAEGPRAGYDKVMTQHPLSRWISAVTKKKKKKKK